MGVSLRNWDWAFERCDLVLKAGLNPLCLPWSKDLFCNIAKCSDPVSKQVKKWIFRKNSYWVQDPGNLLMCWKRSIIYCKNNFQWFLRRFYRRIVHSSLKKIQWISSETVQVGGAQKNIQSFILFRLQYLLKSKLLLYFNQVWLK